MRCLRTLASVTLVADLTTAIQWVGAVVTPTGIMAQVGMSLLPTEAPGLNGVPKELFKRQSQVPFPPPKNWCGFVDGDPNDPLSCVSTKNCVYSSASDYEILKCSFTDLPYCGTYAFDSGTRLYNCQVAPDQVSTVEFLADYYLSELGQTLGSTDGPLSLTDISESISSETQATATVTLTPTTRNAFSATLSSVNTGANTPVGNNPVGTSTTATGVQTISAVTNGPVPVSSSKNGLSTGALVGIIVGVILVILAVIVGSIVFFCLRRRNRRRANQNQNLHTEPMQQNPTNQQNQQFTNPAYNAVPQKDPYNPQNQPYGAPAPMPYNNDFKPPVGTEAAAAPNAEPTTPGLPRYSIASVANGMGGGPHSSLSPHQAGSVSEIGSTGEHYQKQPLSPTITEIEGAPSRLSSPGGSSHPQNQQSYGFGQSQAMAGSHGGYELPNGQGHRPSYDQVSPMQSFNNGPIQNNNTGAGIYEVSGSNSTGPVSDVYEMGNARR
ncbi:hypothetical protein MMC06_000319 [Schaereria dolodes]|nr:hypothetical protein [Schaereria dolodes]